MSLQSIADTAKRARDSMRLANCAFKGDYVAIHSSTKIAPAVGKSYTIESWHIGKVASSSRDGIVKTVMLCPGDFAREVRHYNLLVLTLPTKQAEAARLYANAEPSTQWDDIESFKQAILNA